MGSISTQGTVIMNPSSKLREMLFTLTSFDTSRELSLEACRDDNYCVTPLLAGEPDT